MGFVVVEAGSERKQPWGLGPASWNLEPGKEAGFVT